MYQGAAGTSIIPTSAITPELYITKKLSWIRCTKEQLELQQQMLTDDQVTYAFDRGESGAEYLFGYRKGWAVECKEISVSFWSVYDVVEFAMWQWRFPLDWSVLSEQSL